MRIRSICFAVVASLASTTAFAASDLVPDISQLATNGTLRIVNQGKKPAGPSVATIICTRQGGGSCPEAPGLAAYENAAYPNAATINVPLIPPGQSHSHTLSFWGALVWTPGTYKLAVAVDAGSNVAESNELNNKKVAQKNVLISVGGGAGGAVSGFATKTPAQPRAPIAAATLVAGLPDITGTELGFGINGYTKWGTATTIDQPHLVKATKAGPGKNMCVIGTGLYRTFNKSDFAAGSFNDTVSVNGAVVYTRNVPSLGARQHVNFQNHDLMFQEGMNVIRVKMDANSNVAESDENNTFEVRLLLRVDCDGDGKIAGASPQIKSQSPGSAPRPQPARRAQ